MSKIVYNKDQVQELEQNIYVKSCTEKYITFTDNFKMLCIEQDNLGIYHREIFSLCGFPEYVCNSDVPKNSLGNWRHKHKKGGKKLLIGNTKGRKRKEKFDPSKMSKDEYIEYLEAKLALTEALQELQNNYP